MKQCPICDGILKSTKAKQYAYGKLLGEYPVFMCSKCGEEFTDSKTTRQIENAAKKKKLWGLGSSTKVTKTGNSLAVRIPKKIVDYMKISEKNAVYVYPDKDRIIIESK